MRVVRLDLNAAVALLNNSNTHEKHNQLNIEEKEQRMIKTKGYKYTE